MILRSAPWFDEAHNQLSVITLHLFETFLHTYVVTSATGRANILEMRWGSGRSNADAGRALLTGEARRRGKRALAG